MPERETVQVAEFLGDGIADELSAAVHEVAAALPLDVRFHPVDLTQRSREQNPEACYRAAESAIRAHGVALKYPTVTSQESPNKVLRERCNFAVIHRPAASMKGVR